MGGWANGMPLNVSILFVGEDDPMTVWWESVTVGVPARLGIVGDGSARGRSHRARKCMGVMLLHT
jgi:hypothetical protein